MLPMIFKSSTYIDIMQTPVEDFDEDARAIIIIGVTLLQKVLT
jgi:hypothetical protein